MLIDKVHALVAKGEWSTLDTLLIPTIEERSNGLEAALLYAATLRARNEGLQANQVLAEAAHRRYTADVKVWSQFAEELMQSGLWHMAKDVILKITPVDSSLGNFLQLVFFRETENWVEFDKVFSVVQGVEPGLAQIQAAWADLRRGQLKRAGERLEGFRQATNPAVLKLIARFYIVSGNTPLALENVVAAKKQQPLDWECLALEGVCRPEQALELWTLSLKRQPAQVETLINRARFYAQRSQWNLAQNDCLAALAVKTWSDLPVFLWLQCLQAQKQPDQAWRYLEEQIAAFPTPGRISAQLDLLRARSPKVVDLKKAADKALSSYPTDPQVLLTAGAAFQMTRQLDRAAKCYQQRLDQLPNDMATRNNLAQLYLERGDIELAVEVWREIGPAADDTVRLNLAQALQQRGDVPEAEEIYREVLARNPEQPLAVRGLADVLAEAGDYQQAWTLIQKAIKINPEHPRTWVLAANLQGPLGTPEKKEYFLAQGELHSSQALVLRQALFKFWRSHNQIEKGQKALLDWAEKTPDEHEYWLMLADLRYDRNDFDGAEIALQQAAALDWQTGGAALVRFYESRDRLGAARKHAEQMVRQDPAIMKHHGLLAEVLYRQERYKEALVAIDQGLKREPFRLSLIRQKIGMLLGQELFIEAISCARNLLTHEASPPHIALALTAYRRSRDHAGAVNLCREMLQKYPQHRVVELWLAESLADNRELPLALAVMKLAWQREPRNLKQAAGYINCLMQAELYSVAYDVAQATIAVAGERPDSIIVLSEVLRNMSRHEESLCMLESGIARFPKHQGLARKRVECLRRLRRTEDEKSAILELMNRFPAEHILPWACARLQQLGATKEARQRLTQWQKDEPDSLVPRWAAVEFLKLERSPLLAFRLLDAIERRSPGSPDVLLARAGLHADAWRMSVAIALVRKALELRPDNASYVQTLLSYLVKAGDFVEFDELMNRLKHLYGDQRYGQYTNLFFNINCHPDWTVKQVYEIYNEWYTKSVLPSRPVERQHNNALEPHRKLRLGYVSPDFRRHAVAYFSEPLLVEHDRDQFELFAFAHLELKVADATTERFKGYFDHWIETTEMSNEELEKAIREHQIDILIDLAGHTANHSLGVFLRKPAPIQASYIFGAGQTTGLPEVDYLICDDLTVPPEHDSFVAEKVWRLPFAGLPYRPPHDYLEPAELPCERNGFITFGVMSRPLRTNRRVFAVWAEILRRLPSAKLRFDHVPYAEPDLQNRIQQIFYEHGIDKDQLLFQNTRPHWASYQDLDIQLDPFPAGSGTTITEGLWMERLAIALKSRPPMGRIATAQLTALGLADICCAENEQDYVEKAVALASDIQQLAGLSTGLRAKMKASRLMDYKTYANDVATCYRDMWIAHCKIKGLL